MRVLRRVVVLMMVPLLLGLAVAFPSRERIPVQKGTAEDYWNGAAGVVRTHSGQKTWFLAEPINGTFLYSTHKTGGRFYYYYISADEVFADFPRTIDQLGGEGKVVLGWAEPAFCNWEQVDPLRSRPQLLILLLKEAKQEWWTQTIVG